MNFLARFIVILSFISLHIYSLNSYSNELILAPVNDPALKNLLIRTMYVDKKKRIYLGTDSGLYRYANSNLVKLDNNFAISAKSFNGAISNIQALDDRYLAISAFLSEVIYFDKVNDGYVTAPYGINPRNNYLTSEKTSDYNWLWKTTNELISYSSKNKQYKVLFSTSDNERILNFKYNRQDNSLYVMSEKGLYYSSHIQSPLKLIHEIGQEYFSGTTLINSTLHFLSEKSHLTFKSGRLTSKTTMHFCPQEQQKQMSQKKYEYLHKRPYFYDFTDGSLLIISECGVYQYHIENNQLISLILPPAKNTRQWLKGTSYTKSLPIILETNSGLFLIDKNKKISPLRDKTSASMGGSTFSVVKVNDDQYLIADGTPGLKIASSRLHQFNNLEKSDLERITGGHSLRDIIKIDNNTIWLGSQTNGLFKVIKQQGIWRKQKQFLENSHIRSLFIDNNSLWVATEGSGLHLIDLHSDAISEIPSPSGLQGLLSFLPLINGELLIGTTNGVLIFDKANRKFVRKFPHVRGAVWGMAQSSKGDIWLGTHWPTTGLFKFDNNLNVLETYTYEKDLYQSAIMDIAIDKYEQPILATWGGGLLYRKRNENQFTQLTTEDGLLNDTIQSVIKRTDNQYWLSTEKGLAKVDLCQLNTCIHHVTTYTTNDGLSTNLFDLNSAHTNPDNSLIYGGFFGLTWFNPEKNVIENKILPSEHFINSMKVDGKNVTKNITTFNDQKQIKLDADTQHISIVFNSDDYINQNKKRYRYKINNSEWTISQQPEINLSALTYGSYIIKAGSSNSNGLWTNNNLDLLIIIEPPVWLSLHAKISYVIVILLLVFMIFKRRNAKLIKQNYLLESKVNEKTLQLSDAIAEKEHMFESSSHELQTPLTLILNYLDLLSIKDFSTKNSAYISIIKNQSERLRYLVKNMLLNADTQLITAGSSITEVSPLITTLVEYHKTQAKKSNISLVLLNEVHNEVFVNLVTDSIQVIFGNLIDNAIKYSPNNSIVNIRLFVKNNDFVFVIDDQGPGFKDLSKIGEKYYREAKLIMGTGIGLTNVKNHVSKNQGKLHIANKQGLGSEIIVSLPICEQDNQSSGFIEPTYLNPMLNKEVQGSHLTQEVLLVEDDNNLTSLFKETLLPYFNIHFCSDGEQAIKYLQNSKNTLPELIISDVMMPNMNGFELCKQVKNSEDFMHIPLILLTAKSDNSSHHIGLSLGADDYINKPFKVSSLQLKIKNIIKTNKALKQHQLNYVTTKDAVSPTAIPPNRFVIQVKSSLKMNIDNPDYCIDDLSQSQNMSESTLRRKLKQYFDQTFTQILKKTRMNHAKELLSSDLQVQTIGEHCGYTTPSYFNKHFKAEFGMSPSEFRADLMKNCITSA